MLAPLLRVVSSILWVPLVLSAVLLAVGDVLFGCRRSASRRRRRADSEAARPRRTLRDPALPPPVAVRSERSDPAAMAAALGRALDADPEHRRRYRYIARLEKKMSSHGLLVLEKAPLPGLKRALGELEGMVRNWSDADLAELRSRLAVTVTERGSAGIVWKASVTIAPLARAARNAIARASTFRASRQLDLDAVTR